MPRKTEKSLTHDQAQALLKLVADIVEVHDDCLFRNDPYGLRRYQGQWIKRAKATLQAIDNEPVTAEGKNTNGNL